MSFKIVNTTHKLVEPIATRQDSTGKKYNYTNENIKSRIDLKKNSGFWERKEQNKIISNFDCIQIMQNEFYKI